MPALLLGSINTSPVWPMKNQQVQEASYKGCLLLLPSPEVSGQHALPLLASIAQALVPSLDPISPLVGAALFALCVGTCGAMLLLLFSTDIPPARCTREAANSERRSDVGSNLQMTPMLGSLTLSSLEPQAFSNSQRFPHCPGLGVFFPHTMH